MPRRWISWACYTAAAGVCMAAGILQQNVADYSGVFGPRPAPSWEVLDRSTTDAILLARPPRPEDYFHRVSLGSRMGYRQVFGEDRLFRIGQTVYVIARLQQQHPRLLLHWSIRSPAGEEKRYTRVLGEAYTYAWFGFRMTDESAAAGQYTVILEANGEEVARRTFQLVQAR